MDTMKRVMVGATIVGLVGLIVALFAMTASASHADGGTDEAWTEAMNHEVFWEARFGEPGLLVDCTKYNDHSGFIPASYEAGVVKDGNYVRVYNPAPDDAVMSGAVNPANGQHFAAPHSWVMKCDISQTTTTIPEDATTIPEETTTSSTIADDTTSTTAGTTTTTTTIQGSTVTSPSTTQPESGSTLPFTGPFENVTVLAASAVGLIVLGFLLKREWQR